MGSRVVSIIILDKAANVAPKLIPIKRGKA